MPSDDIVKKLYSKEDIRLELDLTVLLKSKKIYLTTKLSFQFSLNLLA